MHLIRWTIVLLLLSPAAACDDTRKNKLYCEGHPEDTVNCPPDAGSGCTADDACPGQVCNTADGTCVQCTPSKADACTGTSPVCGADNTCGPCTAHTQCASSGVCLPTGACADAATVAYVAPTGTDNTTCSREMPCTKVAKALGTNRPTIKLTGMVKDNATTTIDGKSVTLLADPGTKLDRDGDGPILEVRSANADVKIYDLEITGASGAAGADAIVVVSNGGLPKLTLERVKVTGNQGAGISASGGSLTVTQSTISGNQGGGISASGGSLTVTQSTVSGNSGGGVSITSAQFDLKNNMIVRNGSPTSSFGGVLITQANTGTRSFAFNTVAQNQATTGITPGVLCAAVANAIALSNSIVYGNGTGAQVEGGMCSWTYSDIGPVAATGTGNLNADPKFVNAMVGGDFHIASDSPCRDAADPAANVPIDIDGDTRPQGAQKDIGADEHK